MKLLFKAKPTIQQSLPLRPVFESELVLYARIYNNGNRTVSFEDPSIVCQPYNNTFIGTNRSFELALSDAFHNFYKAHESGVFTDNINSRMRLVPDFIKDLYITTDDWLVKHKGFIRALALEDTTVLVSLEGYMDETDLRTRISVEKIGNNFYNALALSLAEFKKHDLQVLNKTVA